jgi:hypothetical protein
MVEPWQVAAALAVPLLQQHKVRRRSFESHEAANTIAAIDSCVEQQQEQDGEEEEDRVQQSPKQAAAAAAASRKGGGSSNGRRQLKRSCVSAYAAPKSKQSADASTNPYKRAYRSRRART